MGHEPSVDQFRTTDELRLAKHQPSDIPKMIGRYRVEKVLGEGGFGCVYLAHDDQLNRLVAIKVPRSEGLSNPEEAEAYLVEARVVASLDHPNIVPVFDVGTTGDGLCYVVSKVIDGNDLANLLRETRLSHIQAAGLIATVAEALHYAHKKGLVHRDVKPANILIDTNGTPHVADFGLALKEADFGRGVKFAGTPAYMSPEQARGEGHRVDGRSDIFSLGVVFFEILTGKRPFQGETLSDLLDQIISADTRSLRQIDETIPKDLERICYKALSKRASERYSTAKDLAEDLRHFSVHTAEAHTSKISMNSTYLESQTPTAIAPDTITSDLRPVTIIPKGLRSFDAHDADFFLELLPGPRDRDGLPDSVRFWKSRLEEIDSDGTFSVGLIYGPSGCGKTSLMKAGLLPRLSETVTSVYVEATADETETRLLNGLRKRCPSFSADLSLKETLVALRRGQGLAAGMKLVIVLDQFEQWLHAKKNEPNTELVQALRQCDGGRVQCVVMVRDDFWLSVSRFLRELEIRLIEGQNSALVDLFDVDHAVKVLAAFGRTFHKLPGKSGELSKDQKLFLQQAVSGISQEGKVISVRLALFAEMMKNKPWTLATLKEMGGTEGVGATFLEETFSATTAPPEHRFHQKAARCVLNTLLPESGTDIKGHMRSRADLLDASGYANRPSDFGDLIRILDTELRLITPTDPEGKEGLDESMPSNQAGSKYYQLTHDYLVPSLRDWLTRKQKETQRGRAELFLADRAVIWNARPENRQLPSPVQWLQIRWFTLARNWDPSQRKMMTAASTYYAARGTIIAFLAVMIGWGAYETLAILKANALRDRLLDANTTEVTTIVQDMRPYRRLLSPLLQEARKEAEKHGDRRKELNASLALLPIDPSQTEYLVGRLLDSSPLDVSVIRDALAPRKEMLLDRLWTTLFAREAGKNSQRIRAASALAIYDPSSPRWTDARQLIADDLVSVPAVYLAVWIELLRPIGGQLVTPLTEISTNPLRRDAERSLATDVLADYAADQPSVLVELLMEADEQQFASLLPVYQKLGARCLPALLDEVDRQVPMNLESTIKDHQAKRIANAAIVLLGLNRPTNVWPLLEHSSDPRVRSYLIHRLSAMSADFSSIIDRIDDETDTTIRRALLLILGGLGEMHINAAESNTVLPKARKIYIHAADSGLHAASERLLRLCHEEKWLMQINDEWAKDAQQRLRRIETIKTLLSNDKERSTPQWYVNAQGQTMVVIAVPGEFLMGSPDLEEGRYDDETRFHKRIDRSFAIASKPVTEEEYQQFEGTITSGETPFVPSSFPVVNVSWLRAVAYCNWLSEKDGIPSAQWCYEIDPQTQITHLKASYLSLEGYRLPTEAEWEYACRAGTITSRYYGDSDELLREYGSFAKNSAKHRSSVGSRLPNDFGLFDMHGNVWCWCQSRYLDYPQAHENTISDDSDNESEVRLEDNRVLRGGAFNRQAGDLRSALRTKALPSTKSISVGFRPARTFESPP